MQVPLSILASLELSLQRMGAVFDAAFEKDHPRGNPKNPGEFSKKRNSSKSTKTKKQPAATEVQKNPWEMSRLDFGRRSNVFTPAFSAIIDKAAIKASQNKGKYPLTHAGTLRDVLSPIFREQVPKGILDTIIVLTSTFRDKEFGGFITGTTPLGKKYILFHPQQAEVDYVKGIMHEIKHLIDKYEGKEVTAITSEMNWNTYMALPSEKRARAWELFPAILHKRLVRKAIRDGKITRHEDYPDLRDKK